MPEDAERAVDQPVAETRAAAREASAVDAAMLRDAEHARDGGARTSVLAQLERSRREADAALREDARGFSRDDMQHVAGVTGYDISLVRAAFDWLARERVDEAEMHAALKAVSEREV